jgi:hypothetical protein
LVADSWAVSHGVSRRELMSPSLIDRKPTSHWLYEEKLLKNLNRVFPVRR